MQSVHSGSWGSQKNPTNRNAETAGDGARMSFEDVKFCNSDTSDDVLENEVGPFKRVSLLPKRLLPISAKIPKAILQTSEVADGVSTRESGEIFVKVHFLIDILGNLVNVPTCTSCSFVSSCSG